MGLVLGLAAPFSLHAASLQLGGFVDAGSAMRPVLPMVGVSYASHIDDRVDTALVHRPFQLTGGPLDSAPAEGLRPRACGSAAGEGLATMSDAQCAGVPLEGGAPLALTRGNELPTLVAPHGSLPAPMLLPRSTQLSLKVGRLSEDAVNLAAGTDFVVLAKLRYGLTPDHTFSATALRVGPAHLLSAGSDWRLGPLGVMTGGLGLLDRGNGTQTRAVLGHDLQFLNVATGLRWGRTHRPEPGQFGFALSGAAWRALPEDGDTLTATASVNISRHAQLVVTGYEHSPWEGEPARTLSLGSSFQANADNHIGLTVQQTLTSDPTQLLLLTWQMSLNQ
jgi:hypothetical protein